MNLRGMLIGGLLGVIAAPCVFVAVQLLAWGNTAPDWYGVVVVLGSFTIGWSGGFLGGRHLGRGR